ncbi:signal peptidase I, partial [Chloroflexota bacterium]
VAQRVTVQTFEVDGHSMNFSFQNGQRLIVNKVVYNFHEPERGDVVILKPQNDGPDDLIKRIIGLPGESIEIKDGIVYIHKGAGSVFPLDEPYIADPARQPFKGDIIPENAYFVLGDNRNNSSDSRQGWTLPRQDIIGKAWLSIWPSDMWGLAANYPLQEQAESPAK